VAKEGADGAVDCFPAQEVIVVQDEHELASRGGQVVDQRGDDDIGEVGASRRERCQRRLGDARLDRL
jgi:hypothetical protein